MLGHKTSLGKFKKTEIISSIISDPNTMRLETNCKKKPCKTHKHVEGKQHAPEQLKDHWRNQRENQNITGDLWKQKHNDPKSMECSKSSSKREVYSDTSLPQETRKISNKQPNLTPKETRIRTNKTQS